MERGERRARGVTGQLRGVDKRAQPERSGDGGGRRRRRVVACLGEGAEENPEFGTQVSSAVLRYFYRQTRRFNHDPRYFTRARECINIFDLRLLYICTRLFNKSLI